MAPSSCPPPSLPHDDARDEIAFPNTLFRYFAHPGTQPYPAEQRYRSFFGHAFSRHLDKTEAEMWEALEVAQAADFVRSMPGGLNARIEQGGSNVSGGQRQRLSIARALIRRPEVYVFDDSFSALDLATDARLRAALVPYTRDAAVVIVAQRVSTISGADVILVIEDGQLVGRGTHEELILDCPTYAEIVQSQILTVCCGRLLVRAVQVVPVVLLQFLP